MDWLAFNRTVAALRHPWFSNSDAKKVAAVLGPEAVALAEQMIAFAGDQPDLWESRLDWIAVQPEMSQRLRVEYPQLSLEAADRIAVAASYSWR